MIEWVTMRSLLTPLALMVLSASVLAGCSDDDSSPKADPSPSASSEAAAPAADESRACTVTVDISGAADLEWSGKANVRLSESEPKAFYLATADDWSLTVSSPLTGNPASANVTIDGTTYATAMGDEAGIEVQDDGSGAVVDADAASLDETTVHITTEFVCGRKGAEQ